MDLTNLGVTVGILAIVIIIFVLIYILRKNGKTFCNKNFQKGNIFYINVTGIVFYQCNSYQIVFSHTTRIKNFLFIVGYGEANENTVESIELNCKTHENRYKFTSCLQLDRLN